MASDLKNPLKASAKTESGAPAWHTMPVAAVAMKLGANLETGLSRQEARLRAARFGANVIEGKPPRSLLRMFFDQFADFMIIILIAAAVVSGLVGDLKDVVVILVIVVLNAIIGFVQEYRAERAMAALTAMAASNARVIRGEQRLTLPSPEVVPGDIVLLEAGDVIPADVRLVEAVRLKADESVLSGESVPVEKHARAMPDVDVSIGDCLNMGFKGTTITYGRGRGVVTSTGMATEFGKIAALLDTGLVLATPLQKRLAAFGKRLGIVVLAICAAIFVLGLMRGEAAVLMFLTAVSLAVAAIPEALPAVVTISLALGARKMVRQQALIRRLPAVETLGSVTYICADKTGTLTQNKMRLEEIYAAGVTTRQWQAEAEHVPWVDLLKALALSNDAGLDSEGNVAGDPTEVALYLAALEAGLEKPKLEAETPRIGELPFDSERKRMTTIHQLPSGVVAYTKGAPESVLPICSSMLTDDGEMSLSRDEILSAAKRMAAEGLRVLAIAERHWSDLPQPLDADDTEVGLKFIGLVGLMDPPRPEARQAIELCKSAGITPVMITGDHPETARAIARQLGIVEDDGAVMTGPELARLSDNEMEQQVAEVLVYARVNPAQKIRIVEVLQKQGEFVSMTGDGVNDAPALKRAEIGIAMGKGGTDVAREAASLVLLDDNFATIVAAVREGRRIYDNIRKFINYTMTSNAGEIWTILLAPFLGLPIPLLPIHILWINLVTDGLPGLALSVEPDERGIMQRPPRPPKESIFAHGMWQHIVWCGLAMGAVTLFAQAWAIRSGTAHWQTMVFTVLTLSQMGNVLAIRSERESLFRQGLFSNMPLLGAVMLTFLLQIAIIYHPSLNAIFHTAPLTASELGFCLLLSAIVFVLVEIEKFALRRGWLSW